MAKGPAIYDINTLLQAGINPKTGLPTKFDGNLPCNLQNAILKQLRVIDEQDAVNRYVWFNLPTGINASLIERVLFYKGQGCLFYMESDGKFYFLPYALDGSIDVYGRYTGITPLPFNGSVKADDGKEKPWIVGLNKKPIYDVLLPEEINQDVLYDGCVLLSDYSKQISQTVLPRQMLNDPLLSVMSECIPFMRTALQNSTGISGMKVGNEDEQSNVAAASLAIQRAALNGEKWIPIIGSVEFQELTNTPTAKSEEFLLTLQALDNYRLSLYGMENGGLFQKKSHMLEAEQKMNTGNSGIILQDGLKQRLDFCDIANSIWGTSIYCEINETINGTDTNFDGQLGYAPQYVSQPVENTSETEGDEMINQWFQELYGNQRNETFVDIFPSLDDFISEYLKCKLPLTEYFGAGTSEQVSTLYYLLYGKYGNSTIAADDATRFKYRLFSIIYQYGPTWVEQIKLQKSVRDMTLADLQVGGKAVYNTALNPNIAPTTSALDELPYINQQNTTNYAKSEAEAYGIKMSLLNNDVTESFLGRFRDLFLKIVQPTVPLWYITEETEEN